MNGADTPTGPYMTGLPTGKEGEYRFTIPESMEFVREQDGIVYVKKKPHNYPRSMREIKPGILGDIAHEMTGKLNTLGEILALRDAWYRENESLRPDWNDTTQRKYTIVRVMNGIRSSYTYDQGCILAFTDPKARDEFLDSFRNKIDEIRFLL